MSTQTLGFPRAEETLPEKRERASHNIYVATILLAEMQKATETEKCKEYYPKILTYMIKMHEVVNRYCEVYFKYNVTNIVQVLAGSETYKEKIVSMCKFLVAISKFIKVRVHVFIRDDPEALDLLHRIYGRKFNHRVQQFLVKIDYWVDQMSLEEKVRYNLF